MRPLWEVARSQVIIVAGRSVNLASGILNPLMFMTLLLLPRLQHVTPAQATATFSGVLLASLWAASLWSGAGILRRERFFGTLAPTFTGRLSPLAVLTAKTIGGVVFDVGLIAISSLAFVLIAGLSLQIADPVAFGVGLVVTVASGVASSILIGAALLLSRYAFQLTTALSAPVLLLGGTIIPHDILPAWARAIGSVINLAWLQKFLASTASTPDWGALAIGTATSAVYAMLGAICVRAVLRRARKEGTLELA